MFARVLAPILAIAFAFAAENFQATPAGARGHARSTSGGRTVYAEDLLATFTGVVKTNKGKTLRIEDDDKKILEFHATHKTGYFDGLQKINQSDLKPGARVTVDAKQFPDGELETVTVRVLHEMKPATSAP